MRSYRANACNVYLLLRAIDDTVASFRNVFELRTSLVGKQLITKCHCTATKMHQQPESNGTFDLKIVEKLLPESINRPPAEKTPFLFSKRFCVVVLLFFGYLNIVLLKMNLNIAIVEMASPKKIVTGNVTTYREPEYNWDSKMIGLIQSATAYGYPLSVVGVAIIDKLGGAVSVGTSILVMAVLNLLTPASIYASFLLFIASRIVMGFADGIAYMGSLELLSRWAPVPERSTMVSLGSCGIYIGVAISYPVCGYIADRWSWQTVFYISGIEGIIWSCIWLAVVKNRPSKDNRMSKKEQQYVLENTETISRKQIVHPYKEIFKSPPVWALCAGKFTYSWGITLLIVCFPLYVKDMTGRGTDQVGLISSIPNFICILAIPLAGFTMDYWQNNSKLTITQIHKIVMSLGYISGAMFFVIAAYSTSFTLSMTCFVLIKFAVSFNYLILQMVCLYMSPTHTSILGGLSAFWFTLSVILIPNIVGLIVRNHLLEEWSKCFLISGAVLFAGAIIFMIYGSSELQPWSTSPSSSNDKKCTENKEMFKIYKKFFFCSTGPNFKTASTETEYFFTKFIHQRFFQKSYFFSQDRY